MAVAFDAKMTGGNGTSGACQKVAGATSISSTGMTVGSGATLLIVVLHWQNVPTGTISVTWDSVACTINASNDITNGSNRSIIAYLINPNVGNKTLAASWTTSVDCYMSCASFTGTDTSTAVQDFVEGNSSTTVTVTSSTDGATVAIWGTNGSAPTTNFNQIFVQSDLNPGAGASYQLGGTSNAHTFTGAGGSSPAYCGIHAIAGASGPTAGEIAAAAQQMGYPMPRAHTKVVSYFREHPWTRRGGLLVPA